jgi:predicted esterase
MMTDDTYPTTIINTAKVARLATVDLECKPQGAAGSPIILFGFSDGKIILISFHNSSRILLTVGKYLTLS